MESHPNSPIGVFDSGVGGLSILRALRAQLPSEHFVYLADSGFAPYGEREDSFVVERVNAVARQLLDDHAIKALVIACNTATAAGLDELRAELPVPIIDVIGPGARALVQTTVTGRVGVIGTVGTMASGAYVRAVGETGVPVSLTSSACPGFVEFVERGQTTGDEVTVLAERLLAPIRDANVDALLLGCTHYPFLARTISEVMGPDITLVSSADETAFAIIDRLRPLGLLRGDERVGRHRFVSSGDVELFRELGAQMLGPELDHTERWDPPLPDPS